MQLEHLTKESCLHCEARTTAITQRIQHCNGQWFESREYECGYRIEFVPNFNREEVKNNCRKSVSYRQEVIKRDKALVALRNFVEQLDTDEVFKSRVMRELSYFSNLYTVG